MKESDKHILNVGKSLRHLEKEDIKRFREKKATIHEIFAKVGVGNKAMFGRIVLEDNTSTKSEQARETRMTNLINHPKEYQIEYDERELIAKNLEKYYL